MFIQLFILHMLQPLVPKSKDGWQVKGKPVNSFMLWKALCWHGLSPVVSLEWYVNTNVTLNNNPFYPDRSGLFQDDSITQGIRAH